MGFRFGISISSRHDLLRTDTNVQKCIERIERKVYVQFHYFVCHARSPCRLLYPERSGFWRDNDHNGVSPAHHGLRKGHGALHRHGEHQHPVHLRKIQEFHPMGDHAPLPDPDRGHLRDRQYPLRQSQLRRHVSDAGLHVRGSLPLFLFLLEPGPRGTDAGLRRDPRRDLRDLLRPLRLRRADSSAVPAARHQK